jgi:hypothetical protein
MKQQELFPGDLTRETRGRPRVWDDARMAAIAADMDKYTASEEYPTIAGFCYTHDIPLQRLREHDVTKAAMARLNAKRQDAVIKRGLRLSKEDGPLGPFLALLSANAGEYSLRTKTDVEHSGAVGIKIVDDID